MYKRDVARFVGNAGANQMENEYENFLAELGGERAPAPVFSESDRGFARVGDRSCGRFRKRPPNSLPTVVAVPRATRKPRKVGRCPSFKGHFLSPRAKPYMLRFATLFIAE